MVNVYDDNIDNEKGNNITDVNENNNHDDNGNHFLTLDNTSTNDQVDIATGNLGTGKEWTLEAAEMAARAPIKESAYVVDSLKKTFQTKMGYV